MTLAETGLGWNRIRTALRRGSGGLAPAVLLVLQGCMVGPDYMAPDTEVPDRWNQELREGLTEGKADLRTWWTHLDDAELDRLIERATLGNLDLKQSALHDAGRLAFFGSIARLADRRGFQRHLKPVRSKRWVVYAKPPFAGPEAVLAYLARYTHRVAISNSRLIGFDENGVSFRYKDYRRDSTNRQQVMTLATDEFIRRFLCHVLPRGFHRIRHYGLLASSTRKASLALARELLNAASPPSSEAANELPDFRPPCRCCGGRMIVIEVFQRWQQPRGPPFATTMNREERP